MTTRKQTLRCESTTRHNAECHSIPRHTGGDEKQQQGTNGGNARQNAHDGHHGENREHVNHDIDQLQGNALTSGLLGEEEPEPDSLLPEPFFTPDSPPPSAASSRASSDPPSSAELVCCTIVRYINTLRTGGRCALCLQRAVSLFVVGLRPKQRSA